MENKYETEDDLIFAYLTDRLPPDLRQAFEARLADEPALRAAVEAERRLLGGLRRATRAEALPEARRIREAVTRQASARRMRRRLTFGLVGLAGLLLLGYFLFLKKEKPSVEPVPETRKTAAAAPDSAVFHLPSGERLIVRKPAAETGSAPDILEVYHPDGRLRGTFFEKDTLHFLKTPPEKTESKQPSKTTPRTHGKDTVANANGNNIFAPSKIASRRVTVSGGQKIVEPQADISLDVFESERMRGVFYGDRLRLSVPVEVVEIRGAGAEDGFYLRIGEQFYKLKKDGFATNLEPTPKPKALD